MTYLDQRVDAHEDPHGVQGWTNSANFHCLFVCFTGNDYDISVYNYMFTYLLRNILMYFQDISFFLYIGQSRWEDNVTSTKIRGSSTLM